jgi:hypothetical protein
MKQYAAATKAYGVTHPSLPNYLALTGGDTFGVTSDCSDCYVNAPNVVDELEGAGKSWKAYMEGMPSACFTKTSSGNYAKKHNPFVYYDDIRKDATRCANDVPFTAFADDLKSGKVPDFSWITPDQCNDVHSCPVATGDKWLSTWVPQILASPAWKNGGVLFITFDEGTSNKNCCGDPGGGNIVTLVISPLAQSGGYQSTTPYDHYSLLRTIEGGLGLGKHAGAAASATPMADLFKKG